MSCVPVVSCVSVEHDYSTRNRSVPQQNEAWEKGLYNLAGCTGRRRLRLILSSGQESPCTSRGVVYRVWGNSRIETHRSLLPQSGMRKSSAPSSKNASRKCAGKQRFSDRDQCSKNALPERASAGQVLQLEARQGSVLLHLPKRKTEALTVGAHRPTEGNNINAVD